MVEGLKKKANKESCDLCNYASSRKIDLKRHIDRVHLKLKPFQCEKCQQSFENKYQLEHHMKSFHLNFRPYKCKLCYRAPFFQERNLKNHVATVHSKIATIK